jgi:hypothetical protein
MSGVNETALSIDSVGCGASFAPALAESLDVPSFTYDLVCRDSEGNEKWRETFHNLVTTAGKTDIVDKYFKGSAYTAAWYLGLKSTGTPVIADTLASHASWTELNPYTGNRPAIAFGTTAAGSNTATGVPFTMNATATVAGAFIASVNTGTGGVLYSAGDFGVARGMASGDTLTVTPTVSVS